MRVRPRAKPTTAETRKSTTAIKKMTLAISIEAPAMPPKPKMPAISAMIKNVTTQLNMVLTSVRSERGGHRRRASVVEIMWRGNKGSEGSGPQKRQKTRRWREQNRRPETDLAVSPGAG